MVGALLQLGANPDTRNDFGSPIIKWAAELGNADVVRLLVDAGSDVDAGASLWTAVSYGHTEVVRLLVDAGADVNLKDNLWNSDPSGGSLLDFAKWNGNPEIIQILVDAGAKATEQVTVVEEGHFPEAVEERYPTTASGLYGAVADGDVAAVRRLVEAGVDVDAKAAGGESILNVKGVGMLGQWGGAKVYHKRLLASVNVRTSCSGEVSQRQAGSRLGG